MKKSDIFWQSYLSLEKEALEVSKFIYITDVKIVNCDGEEVTESCDSQLMTFSPHIADLLIRCCVQIEAISKELYYENGGIKERGDISIKFDEDCLKKIDINWETHKKSVLIVAPLFNLTKDENKIFRPLREAHKRQGTYWEKAYQAVKHDRLTSLHYGNIKAFLQALAALYLLNLYYRNDSWITKYEDISKRDYSMGSAIFSVKPPIAQNLWNDNKPIMSDSPFIVKYKDKDYNRIETMRKKEFQALNNYWQNQPELQEPEFIAQLTQAFEEEKKDPSKRVMHLWELAIYRLNKKIPQELPFKERKARLINSEEWNGWINQHNKHLAPDEITEENIQSEIKSVGIHWGMELMKRFQKLEWLPIALNSEICEVCIPKIKG